MSDSRRGPSGISRRRFIATVSAGSAALLAQPLAAAAAAARRTARKPAPPPPPTPASTAFDQQRASTLATLQVIRKHPLPPGGDLGAVFRPLTRRRRTK